MSKKLVQVLEYLIAGKQDKAKDLLHQVFIEKARKIHEDIMSHDDMEEDDVLGGDMGDDFRHDVMGKHNDHLEGISDEIDNEETMAEEEGDEDMDDMGGDDVDVEDDDMMDPATGGMDSDDDMGGDDMDDMVGDDMDKEGMSSIEDTIGDLEDALAELKAEFDRLEGGEAGEGDEDMDDMGGDDMDDMGGDDMDTGSEDDESDDEAGDEDNTAEDDDASPSPEEGDEEMDESWLDEDWDDLAEAIELEKVKVPTSGEVGSGTYNSSDANAKSKSPIATSQTSRMGAKPISVKDTPHRNYERETAPTSKSMDLSNRRKTATTGMGKVSKEGNSPNAMINKTKSEFGTDTVGKDSPFTKSIRK
jgi:hypothetical protein